jgi:hypothetical protein
VREINTGWAIGRDLINPHANLYGMFYGEKKEDPFGKYYQQS